MKNSKNYVVIIVFLAAFVAAIALIRLDTTGKKAGVVAREILKKT